jgi:hypothetical protein
MYAEDAFLPETSHDMVTRLLIALALMSACVVIHATGIAWAIRRFGRLVHNAARFWQWMGIFVQIAALVVMVHLVEIVVWGLFYVRVGGMPDFESAWYFSAVTYTTTGYGDLVLPPEWRLLGAVEALTGILMCGWSTGFFFAVVSRMFEERNAAETDGP